MPVASSASSTTVGAAPEVVVVGAGPAGLVASLTLARYGVRVLLLEKHPAGSNLSRALVISTRSMELLRGWGLEDAVRSGAVDVDPCAWVAPSLASPGGRVMPLGYPTRSEAAAISPTRPAWAPQDHLEPLLLGLLHREPTATIRFGAELIAVRPTGAGVRVEIRDRVSERVERVDAPYLIAADGAHSTVRDQVGITMVGPDDLAEFHRVEFRGPLAEVAGPRRFGLYVITDPAVAGVLAPRGVGDRWSLSKEWRPDGGERMADCSTVRLVELVRAAAGVEDLPIEIEGTTVFRFAAQLADRYRAGRCFLVGDAAHRMTPRGGTGMNTAIQDAANLAWKLAAVLRGWARADVLDSYEAERRPVGAHNVERAGSPDGARREASEALAIDLDGRLAHHWLDDDHTVSTLDLLGDRLTLLTGPRHQGWTAAVVGHEHEIRTRALPARTAEALGLSETGALLVRPDAKEVARWDHPSEVERLNPLAPYAM